MYIGLVLLGVALLGGPLASLARDRSGPGEVPAGSEAAAMTASPSPTVGSALPSDSATSEPRSSSPSASPGPSVALDGETPGPDATAPPDAPQLAGIELVDVIQAAASAGMTCTSNRAMPETGAGYALNCERVIEERSARLDMLVLYWTSTHIVTVHGTMNAEPPGDTVIAAESVMSDFYSALATLPFDATDSQALRIWVTDRIGDPDCVDLPCLRSFGAVTASIQTGIGGAGTIGFDETEAVGP